MLATLPVRRWGLASVLSIGLLVTTLARARLTSRPVKSTARRTSAAGSSGTARSGSRCSGWAGTSPRSDCSASGSTPSINPLFVADRHRLQRPPGVLPPLRPGLGRRATAGARRARRSGLRRMARDAPRARDRRGADLLLRSRSAEDAVRDRTRGDGARWRAVGPGRGMGRESRRLRPALQLEPARHLRRAVRGA